MLNSNLPPFSSNNTASYYFINSTSSPIITTTQNTPGLKVQADAEFEGDIIWKGRNLGEFLEKIESRLAILQPIPEKLEKYEALKKAYDNYKLIEKLVENE